MWVGAFERRRGEKRARKMSDSMGGCVCVGGGGEVRGPCPGKFEEIAAFRVSKAVS